MRILITNDDGIHAPGLAVLERIAAALSDDVVVVAPETDQSGVAHSLSMSDPLRLREVSDRRFAVKGTPTDCVILGCRLVLKDRRPDLILSGVNRGQNAAEDVTYSGTVAGAMEGTLLGIPSVALSQAYGASGDRKVPAWACAETLAPPLLRKILAEGIGRGTLLNLNFPDRAPEAVTGVAVTRQGRRDTDLMRLQEREDGRGNPYFWINFDHGAGTPETGTDLDALARGMVSVTPLRLDLTDEAAMLRYVQALT